MAQSSLDSLKIKAKLLQKAKKRKGNEIPLKESYALIAKTSGFNSWKEMKDECELADLLNPPKWSAIWKIWFSSREEAIENMKEGHFLLPYKKQFFICDENYISALGLSTNDDDIEKIGNDWSCPKDQSAWARVLNKIKIYQSKK